MGYSPWGCKEGHDRATKASLTVSNLIPINHNAFICSVLPQVSKLLALLVKSLTPETPTSTPTPHSLDMPAKALPP